MTPLFLNQSKTNLKSAFSHSRNQDMSGLTTNMYLAFLSVQSFNYLGPKTPFS